LDQGIFVGTAAVLNESAAALGAQGALCKRLEVRMASHSHWMASAQPEFAAQLQDLHFGAPSATVVLNASGSGSRLHGCNCRARRALRGRNRRRERAFQHV